MLDESTTMDGLQIQLREKLAGKKFLLVLDDVWTENYERWHTLTQYLMGGQRGSWIVVTTRSQQTVRIIGGGPRHELQGLTKEKSWCLFKRVAFGSQHENLPEDLVEIGQDIVGKCANVPLAIRVVGSLLYGQEKNKWLLIQKLGLAEVNRSEDSIIPTLKLSYYQLESPLKSCLSYCAVFPIDYVMRKDTLIRLWIAQGYIPLDDPHSPEDLAEEYFSILLRRCFFQDVEKDEDGNIRSCKIHDLMHDLAQQVVGKEICRVKTMNGDVDKKVRHLSLVSITNFCFTNKSHIRSYLHVIEQYQEMVMMDQVCVDALIGNWKYLRALYLSRSMIKSLPYSVGELIHLRYLDLSYNLGLQVIPGSITKLYNLQTLDLSCCSELKELPKDLRRLVKLRVLDLDGCKNLSYMPRGMCRLSCLHTLNRFVVGGTSLSKKEVFDGLEDLRALRNLKGYLKIRIHFTKKGADTYKINGEREGGCLGNKEHLKEVLFEFDDDEEGKEREDYDEAVMEELQPFNSNLKKLWVYGYQGLRMPRWVREDNLATFLPNLVEMRFDDCQKLQYLGQLRLPRLKILDVYDCPNLTAILECPALEVLELYNINERLEIIPVSGDSSYGIGPKLREVSIDNVAWLNSLPMDSFQGGAKLRIRWDEKVESLGEAREVFRSCSSSLKYLEIESCSELNSVISGGLEHLSTLEDLEISGCCNLSQSEQVEKEYSFCQSLCSLKLTELSQLLELPNWIRYLTALQTLHIWNCEELGCMPNWMSELTSLKELRIAYCSTRLKERWQQSTGEDWPIIQHIPHIVFQDYDDDNESDQVAL
ncbi:putative disease resistance protein RGA1 [Chenopodium quinoa]|uniref:putative disease resistance protein RGA1 n=1 Tax=Chenopodium quinoa TaxID=63459 RepID=UPI000B78FE9D|nr:putative disease resistance protein RGA1 [Chenopodium quinoa]